jgi:hypothetical protein
MGTERNHPTYFIPIGNSEIVSISMPDQMTCVEWENMIGVLTAMRDGIVVDG